MRRSTLHRLLAPQTATELVEHARAAHPGAVLPGDDPNVVMADAARMVRGVLEQLREIEREHPGLPRFDESTLPKRTKGENEFAWRERQLDFLQAYVRGLVARLDQ